MVSQDNEKNRQRARVESGCGEIALLALKLRLRRNSFLLKISKNSEVGVIAARGTTAAGGTTGEAGVTMVVGACGANSLTSVTRCATATGYQMSWVEQR